MKIYIAGTVGVTERERRNIILYRSRLFSYHYIIPDQIEHKVFKWVKSYLRECRAVAGNQEKKD